jgi:hypothetical protein
MHVAVGTRNNECLPYSVTIKGTTMQLELHAKKGNEFCRGAIYKPAVHT